MVALAVNVLLWWLLAAWCVVSVLNVLSRRKDAAGLCLLTVSALAASAVVVVVHLAAAALVG